MTSNPSSPSLRPKPLDALVAAAVIARMSASSVISSTAMTCGLALRSSMGIPTALGQPSSTSVWHPTSSCGTPRYIPASSPRSSTTPTRSAARSSVRSGVSIFWKSASLSSAAQSSHVSASDAE